MRLLTISCAVLALCACQKPSGQANAGNQAEVPPAPGKGADRSQAGSIAPPTIFNDAEGRETTLAAFKGKPTLVNLWASWCAPCVKELPTLDRLAKGKGAQMNVVAISQDMAPHASVEAFLKGHQVSLAAYQDPKMALWGKLHADVLPTSILYDAAGKEVWRYVGDLDWTSAEAAKLLAEAGVSTRR